MHHLMIRAFRYRLGRRGAFLLSFGFINVVYGVAILRSPVGAVRATGLEVLTRLMAIQDWGWLWIGSGIVAAAFAQRRQGRDGPGFLAAMAVPLLWMTSYLAAAIRERQELLAYGAVIYGVWIAALFIASGWPEPPNPTKG